MKLLSRLALLFLLTLSSFAEELTSVEVVGDNVNMRASRKVNAEVVGQANFGDQLQARSFEDEWVEIVPPEGVVFYIHRDFIKEGRVSARTLRVRAGPSINYSIVGELKRGDAVSVEGEFGEFLKIAPPVSCSLWINASFVEKIEPEGPATLGSTRADGLKVPGWEAPGPGSAPDRTIAPPRRSNRTTNAASLQRPEGGVTIPSDWKLVPLEGQGKTVDREGRLKPVRFVIKRPASFQLVRYKGDEAETECYVYGNKEQLKSLSGSRMRLTGRQYWLEGVSHPVLVVNRIKLLK